MAPPERMDNHMKMRLRAAAFRATRVYPGPVGELLSREILTWEEFGYRLGGGQLMMRVVDYVLKAPIRAAEIPLEDERFPSAVGYDS